MSIRKKVLPLVIFIKKEIVDLFSFKINVNDLCVFFIRNIEKISNALELIRFHIFFLKKGKFHLCYCYYRGNIKSK